MAPGFDPAKVNDAVTRAKDYQLCPHRVWAIARTFDEWGKTLPELIPSNKDKVKGHNYGKERHDRCTFDFCELSRIDYTFMKQRHECPGKDCTSLRTFSPEILKNAAEAGHILAWKLNGESMVRPPEPYMAISHVWADGTGTGTGVRPEGQVNQCLYDFFRQIAEKLKCTGIWWDTICIPREKEAKMKAISNMSSTYANARITLVHDCYLREWEWSDERSACFAIVMSPWFTRGWTALELAQSRKVKVMFKSKSQGYVLKDLDYLLYKQDSSPAADAIRKLRGSRFGDTHDLVSTLGPRITSKPKDMAIIAALLTDIRVLGSLTQQEIYQNILMRIEKVAVSQLFHSSAPMSGGFSWCPTNLLEMPMAPTRRNFLTIQENGNLTGFMIMLKVPEHSEQTYDWKTIHPLTKAKVETHLKEIATHLLLVEPFEPNAEETYRDRALLVMPVENEEDPHKRLHCRLIGPVYFRNPKAIKEHEHARIFVTIGDMDGLKSIERNAWDFANEVQQAKEVSEDREMRKRALGEDDSVQSEKKLSRIKQTGDPNILGSKESRELLSTMMLLAAEKGDDKVAKLLFRNGAKPDAKDSKGQTALLLAAINGNLKIAELLLQNGAKSDGTDSNGRTALLLAAMNGHKEMVGLLLRTEPGPDPDIPDNYSWTALHYAAWKGDADVVEKLLKRADPNVPDNLGQLPLHLGAERNYPKVVSLLCEKTTSTRTCADGQTALHRAVLGGVEVTTMLRVLLGDQLVLARNVEDRDNKTPLDLAAENGFWWSYFYLTVSTTPPADVDKRKSQSFATSNGHTDFSI